MAQKYPHLHFVILAEDYGVKLWPIAREQAPACFAPAEPGSSESLLSATVARTKPFTDCPLQIVTTQGLSELMYGELASRAGLALDDFELLTLPEEHGSTFAIAMATARIKREDPEAIVAVLRADQHMSLDERWEHLLYHVYLIALRDRIVLVAGEQQEKCADLSYVRPGRLLDDAENAYDVKEFVGDAQALEAGRAINTGAWWYSGIFMARASVLLRAISQSDDRNETSDKLGVGRIAEAADFFALLDREALMKEDALAIIDALPVEDIESAVFPQADALAVMPTSIVFETLNSLSDLDGLGQADERKNRLVGNALAVDSSRTTVVGQGPNRSITTFGMDETLVVDTPDALFIANKNRLRDLGDVFDALRKAKIPQLAHSARRPFPWGSATLLVSDEHAATWQVQLRTGAVFYGQSIPAEYGARGKELPREQYVVTGGRVSIETEREGDEEGSEQAEEPVRMDAGDAFESDPDSPLVVSCEGDGPATLILTAVFS